MRVCTRFFVLILLVNFSRAEIQVQVGVLLETDRWSDTTMELVKAAVEYANDLENINIQETYGLVERANSFKSAETVCSLIQSGSKFIVSFVSCNTARYIALQSRALAIPQMLFTSQYCGLEDGGNHTFSVLPHYTTRAKLIAKLVSYNDWSAIVLLSDSTLDSIEKQDIIIAVSKIYTRTVPMGISNGEETQMSKMIRAQLRRIKRTKSYNIVACVSRDTTETLIKVASEEGMFAKEYKWIFMMDDVSQRFADFAKQSTSNVIVVRRNMRYINDSSPLCLENTKPNSNNTSGNHVIDLTVFDGALALAKGLHDASVSVNFSVDENLNCRSKPLTKMKNGDLISSYLKQVNFRGMSGQIAFNDHNYPLDVQYEICSTYADRNDALYKMGYWSSLSGLNLKKEQIFKNKFKDFGNQTLLIGSQETIPYVIATKKGNTTEYTGFCIDILNELASRFMFNYTIVEPMDHVWGARDSDRTWNGVIGMLIRGEVAFGVGPFTITALRESVVDFTKPFSEDGSGILTQKPSDNSGKIFKMFQPFATIVWGCIILTVLVVGVGLYIVRKFSPYTACNTEDKNASLDEISLLENMWLIYGSYMEQGGEPRPTSISGRCILGFWWLFTILMASTYTANLAAFLTVSIANQPIDSLSQLVKQDEIKPIIKASGNLESLFKEAQSGIYKDVWGSMSDSPIVKSNEDALTYVKHGTHAFMADRSQLEYIVLNDCNTYSIADEIFNTAGYGFVLPENSPYMEAFNFNIMKMQEAGLIDKWKQEWWPRSDRCSTTGRISTANILGLDNLAGPFLIFLCVTIIAVGCLLVDIFVRSPSRCVSKNRVSSFKAEESFSTQKTPDMKTKFSK